LATQATEGLAQAGANAGLIEKFKALPKVGQIGVGLGAIALLWLLFGGGGSPTTPQGNPNLGMVGGQAQGISPTSSFQALETDRPALMQNVQEQNRREMAELRTKVEEEFAARDATSQAMLEQNQQLMQQMQEMLANSQAEMERLRLEREQDANRMAQLADQQKQMELGAPVGDATAPNGMMGPNLSRRQPIRQTSLGPPPQGTGGGRALLAPLTSGLGSAASNLRSQAQAQETAKTPFIPPLGFVEATLLNGVDALVGGQATPALARISGNYTTAMNTTVSLDGCIVMLEFNGFIATERAVGKPVRMTCVYPDGGAATYELSGYVVDAEDGVIGVPGLLYEGDPTRIAASIVADFLAGVGSIVAQNQTTTQTSTQTGVATRTLTGDQTRAELAGGVDKAFTSIRDYLKERVDRTTPFIRLDALRTVNLVISNGQELRSGPNGAGAWTLLFDSQASAAAAAPAVSPQPAGGPQ
jgi:conjugal transfer pilus assembly protein TraB